jgi:hypothetical protein
MIPTRFHLLRLLILLHKRFSSLQSSKDVLKVTCRLCDTILIYITKKRRKSSTAPDFYDHISSSFHLWMLFYVLYTRKCFIFYTFSRLQSLMFVVFLLLFTRRFRCEMKLRRKIRKKMKQIFRVIIEDRK